MHRIGIDIGGVIIDRTNNQEDTSFFGANYLNTPEVPGAIDAIGDLSISDEFADGVWIVSKCREVVEKQSRNWLGAHGFFERTTLTYDHLRFTPTRIGKLAIAQELELTDFVDDRAEVLSYLIGSVPNLYLFNPDPAEMRQHQAVLKNFQIVPNWNLLHRRLLPNAA